jgi:predicted ATP-grasp superfamily ATP-dependent carboligase
MSINALVTDCHTKHGFAIARSLRQKGLGVISQYPNKISPFFLSLRNRPKIVYSLRNQDQLENFISFLEKNRPEVLIPVSNLSVKIISDHREQISKFTKVLLPGKDSLDIAQNKKKTFKFAEELGVLCPKTIYDTKDIIELDKAIKNISFPVVLKYVNVNETGVRYCKSIEEIKSILSNYNNPDAIPPILQEFIEGVGVGFYALYKDGKCLNYFMHKRIHEYPVTGGSSSFAMSIYNEELKNAGMKILDSLNWNGIAMVEFKLNDKNELYLIEINPKVLGFI